MPSVTFDGQSLSVKGRRLWLAAREFHYALIERARWGDRLRELRHAGFNAIVAPCPWHLHEASPGRLRFDDRLALRELLTECSEQGLWVILKMGPAIGAPYENAGLPRWLSDLPEVRLRQSDPVFFERVTAWFGALGAQAASLLATDNASPQVRARRAGAETGPLIAVQVEDDWRCGHERLADSYLNELVRFVREVGFSVPVLTANGAFAMVDGAIESIDVGSDAVAFLRQITALRPGFPRLARVRDDAADGGAEAMTLASAAGGQCILRDARGATASSEAIPPAVRRVAQFASSFGHLLAQASVVRAPIVADPAAESGEAPTSLLPLAGDGGTALFVVRRGTKRRGPLPIVLGDGRTMQVTPGVAPISWFLFDADLGGRSRLDFASATPFALTRHGVLALVAAAGEDVVVSIDGTEIALKAPAVAAGPKPATARVREITIVLCNEAQADAALVTDAGLIIGARAVDAGGGVALAPGFRAAVRVADGGEVRPIAKDAIRTVSSTPAPTPLDRWISVPATEFVDGESPRYASLSGASSLAACGARDGFGWYRLRFRRAAAGKCLLHAPELGDRASLWIDGTALGTFGPGDARFPIELKLSAGQHTLTVCAESSAGPAQGNAIGRRTGLYGPPVEVSAVRAAAKVERGVRVDPFALGFVHELHAGDARPGIALVWKFAQRTAPIFVLDMRDDVRSIAGGGTITYNGAPVARWNADGTPGSSVTFRAPRITLPKGSTKAARAAAASAKPVTESVDIRLVLDGDATDAELAALVKGVTLYEVQGEIGAQLAYAFARWSPPPVWPAASQKAPKATPIWSRATLKAPPAGRDAWLEGSGVGSGSAIVNGRSVGRFDGGLRLFVPASFLVPGQNEIVLFDRLGVAPRDLSLRWI